MSKTFAEKILSTASGKDVRAGDVVVVSPDFWMSHENTTTVIDTFRKTGLGKVHDASKIVIILDHTVPASSTAYANRHKQIREFAREQNLVHFHDMLGNGGVCHQIMCQEGYAFPGAVTVGADSHSCTPGALGAFSVGIGHTEMAAIWATGHIWLQVPRSFKIRVQGRLAPGVCAKDFILKLIGDMRVDGADYASVEFHGPGIESLSVAERMTLCNMGVEMGAKNAVCKPDGKVEAFLAGKAKKNPAPVWADDDAAYAGEFFYDLDTLEPGVAMPHTVDNYAPLSRVGRVAVDQVLIGSCTNGRIEDLRVAASVLKGRRVAVRTLVYPASQAVLRQAIQEGLIQTLLDAGCLLNAPGCGPCSGVSGGLLADGETCVTTANRNFKGRMGNTEAYVYLASPATAAWSAVHGELRDPREALS